MGVALTGEGACAIAISAIKLLARKQQHINLKNIVLIAVIVNFSVVWDGRVVELDLFGIPKGSQYKKEALDFIRFASSTKSLAEMVTNLPNGPTRKSSLALLSDDVLAQIPNGPAYDDQLSILSDAQWWSNNHAVLEEAFDAWIAESAQQGASGTVR